MARILVVADSTVETDAIIRILERSGDIITQVTNVFDVRHTLESVEYDLALIRQSSVIGDLAITLIDMLQIPARQIAVYERGSDTDFGMNNLRWRAKGYAGYCQTSPTYPDLFSAHVAVLLYQQAA